LLAAYGHASWEAVGELGVIISRIRDCVNAAIRAVSGWRETLQRKGDRGFRLEMDLTEDEAFTFKVYAQAQGGLSDEGAMHKLSYAGTLIRPHLEGDDRLSDQELTESLIRWALADYGKELDRLGRWRQ
jgi:hypothetical protein